MQITPHANITMSSREIAELTGKQHSHVKRDIEHMLEELGKDASSFGRIYLDSMNRQQTEYHLDRELTQTLITGYNIPLRHKVIQRLNELETARIEGPVANVDPRLAQIAYSLRSGLITQAEANARASAVLDQVAPVRSTPASAPRLPRIKAQKQQLARASGRFVQFGQRHEFYLHELAAWVDGGMPALEAALIDGGFMHPDLTPTAKGKHLFIKRRGHRPLVYARETLDAIGALR